MATTETDTTLIIVDNATNAAFSTKNVWEAMQQAVESLDALDVLSGVTVAAEGLLDYMSAVYKDLDQFLLSSGKYIVAKAGLSFSLAEAYDALGRLQSGEAFSSVYDDLSTALSGLTGSAGLALEGYAQMVIEGGNAAAGTRLLALGTRLNLAGMTFTGGTIIGSIVYDHYDQEILDSMEGLSDTFRALGNTPDLPVGAVKTEGSWTIIDYGNGVTHKMQTPQPDHLIIGDFDQIWRLPTSDGGYTQVKRDTQTGDMQMTSFAADGNWINHTYISEVGNGLQRVYTETPAGAQSLYLQQTTNGESLVEIAQSRDVPLQSLIDANPEIADPNLPLTGISVVVPLECIVSEVGPTTNTIAITTRDPVTGAIMPGASDATEGQTTVANQVAAAGPNYIVAFSAGELNGSSIYQTTIAGMATDGIRPGNMNVLPNGSLGFIPPHLGSGNPFGTTNYVPTYVGPDGQATYLPAILVSSNSAATQQDDQTYVDPLILDLNGDGVRLTNFTERTVLFDIDHDGGSLEQTGWVSAEDGILVHDLNGNGKIDGIHETLSEYYNGAAGTEGEAGEKRYSDGFAALQSLDSNHDNQFNDADAAWDQLRVWVDADSDGITDAGELKTLFLQEFPANDLVWRKTA